MLNRTTLKSSPAVQKFIFGAEIYPPFCAVTAENAMKVDENVDSDPNIDLFPLHRLVI